VLSRVTSTDIEEIVLDNSFHVATLDNDAPMIFKQTLSFIDRIAAPTTGGRR
jgi:carboxylesterase